MTSVKLIACCSQNRVIGKDGDLIYRFKEDMAKFVEKTTGHTVVMGRKTWDSIPEKYRPLKDRFNLVLSKTKVPATPGGSVAFFDNVEEIMSMVRSGKEEGDLWVIGGAMIYEAFLPYADEIHLTLVYEDAEGDTFFPPPSPESDFEMINFSDMLTDGPSGKKFNFQTFKRVKYGDEI